MNIFQTLGQKLRVLLSIICGTKINLEWVTHPFLDLPPPPLCLTNHPLILKFFQPPIIQYFEDSVPHICKWGGEGWGGVGVQTMIVPVGGWKYCIVLW